MKTSHMSSLFVVESLPQISPALGVDEIVKLIESYELLKAFLATNRMPNQGTRDEFTQKALLSRIIRASLVARDGSDLIDSFVNCCGASKSTIDFLMKRLREILAERCFVSTRCSQ